MYSKDKDKMEFRVMPSLNQELALTNSLYVNPRDATTPYVRMGRNVYRCVPHPEVDWGTVRMNAIARRAIKNAEKILLNEFVPNSVPIVKELAVTAEPVKLGQPEVAPTNLANIIRNNLDGHIVCFDQKFTFQVGDHAILVTITDGDAQGFVDSTTQVNMMWRNV
jgi:hypothetical protein